MPRIASTDKKLPPHNLANHSVKNSLILALSDSDRDSLLAKLEPVALPTHFVLNESGERILYAYFLNEGLASVLTAMEDGKSVEVGLFGRDGFVGSPLLSGYKTSNVRVIIQVAGSGYRIPAKDLSDLLAKSPALALLLARSAQQIALQSAQIAACNRLHEVDQRLARWLLMSQDCLGGSVVPLTQEFLAHMLGTRRASVTVAAGILQKAGLIEYKRGVVEIKNRNLLIESCCECYRNIARQTALWLDEASSTLKT